MKKIFYFDTETTGINPKLNAIIQLACVVEVNGEVVGQKDFNIRPFEGDELNKEALAVNGKTVEDLKGYTAPREAYTEIRTFMDQFVDKYDRNDKFYPAGFNVRFDMDFLSEFFRKADPGGYGLGCYFNWRYLDPLPILYVMDFQGRLNLPNYKLKTACDHFGVSLDNAHDAIADIMATRELLQKVNKQFQLLEV